MEKNKHIWLSVPKVSNTRRHISSEFISGQTMESKVGDARRTAERSELCILFIYPQKCDWLNFKNVLLLNFPLEL